MKKLIIKMVFLLVLVFSTSCITDNDCIKCTGYSTKKLAELNELVQNKYISYETYVSRLSKANNCNNTVCNGNKHCYLHN